MQVARLCGFNFKCCEIANELREVADCTDAGLRRLQVCWFAGVVCQEQAGVRMVIIQESNSPTNYDKPLRITGDRGSCQVSSTDKPR